MTDFYACVTYYSLPSFPTGCALIKNPDVLPRDVLLCNRTNIHHIKGGMQYDPNLENCEYRICEPPTRRSLQQRANDYDRLFLVFRTRQMRLDKARRYLVTGFYEVKKDFEKEQREAPIIYAKAMHFVSISDSVDITERMMQSGAFRCCFTSENLEWANDLTRWASLLEEKENQAGEYIAEIKRLKETFRQNEWQGNDYSECNSCKQKFVYAPQCPLIWRRKRYEIHPHPANFMKSLDEYFESVTGNEVQKIT